MKDLWYGKTHVQLGQSQLIHDIWQLKSQIWRKFIVQMQRHLKKKQNNNNTLTVFWILRAGVSTYPDLAELHLDLFGDNVGPVLLSQEVPEYPSQKGIHPGLRLHRLP